VAFLVVCYAMLQCLCELVNEAPFLYTTELDNVASLCFRAMDNSNYDVRCDVAKLLGRLLAATQAPQAAQGLCCLIWNIARYFLNVSQ